MASHQDRDEPTLPVSRLDVAPAAPSQPPAAAAAAAAAAADEKAQPHTTSLTGSADKDGIERKYSSSADDLEAAYQHQHDGAGGGGGGKEALTPEEAEQRRLDALIGVPDHRASPLFSRLSPLFHSQQAVVARDVLLILLLLGIWIPSIVREQTRGLWVVTTIWAWFFILLILLHKSRYIPQRPFIRVISGVWNNCISRPFFSLPYYARLALGWSCLLLLFLAPTFAIAQTPSSTYERRGIALVGITLTYLFFFSISANHTAVKARTTICGLGLQMALGLFVYKTNAGRDLFQWISTAATDLLSQATSAGAAFFFSTAFVANHYFFVNVLSVILFFVALCTALFYIGLLGWCIKKFAWFFSKTFGISGAEAIVAAASPFIGQGENCILTKPYVPLMTDAELFQVLVSGMATCSGSVLIAYISLGISGRDLILSSIMSIPGSIAAAKLVLPETQRPRTLGKVRIAHDDDDEKAVDVLHALSNGAWFGLRVAGLILCNVLVIVSLVAVINGLLSWIGQFWGLERFTENELSLELIGSYIFYPFIFMLGVPGSEVLKVSRLFATKIVQNEFVAYAALRDNRLADPNFLSEHSLRICTLLLCGFGNIGSAGINVGILSALAPKRAGTIVKLTPKALMVGILVTSMTAAIGGLLSDDGTTPLPPPKTG